jgi:cytochrome c-type biogenesis protein CcmF
VGPPYFESIFVPLMAPMVLLMGLAPFARWKKASAADFPRAVWGGLLVSVFAAIAAPLAMGGWSLLAALGVFLGCWAILASLIVLLTRAGSGSSPLSRLAGMSLSQWGMVVAHVGVGAFIIGVTFVKAYESNSDVKMSHGDTTTVGGYTFTFKGVNEVKGPNYIAARARIEVSRDGKFDRVMEPEKRIYTVQRMPMTEAAIDTGVFRDLYVSLGEPLDMQTWVVRVQHKPMVDWIWWGCLLMGLGGVLAAADRRYRLTNRSTAGDAALSSLKV